MVDEAKTFARMAQINVKVSREASRWRTRIALVAIASSTPTQEGHQDFVRRATLLAHGEGVDHAVVEQDDQAIDGQAHGRGNAIARKDREQSADERGDAKRAA